MMRPDSALEMVCYAALAGNWWLIQWDVDMAQVQILSDGCFGVW